MNNKKQQTVIGKVISQKMNKTLVVKVERLRFHPLYKKQMRLSKKYHAHCEDSSKFKVGDVVMIGQCRPYAKTVSWKIISSKDKNTVKQKSEKIKNKENK